MPNQEHNKFRAPFQVFDPKNQNNIVVAGADSSDDAYLELGALSIKNKDNQLQVNNRLIQYKPIKTIITGNSITVTDNTEYTGTNITSLDITFPNVDFECYMMLTFAASGTIAITFPNTVKSIGSIPAFANGETWEISIKNGVVVCGNVQ